MTAGSSTPSSAAHSSSATSASRDSGSTTISYKYNASTGHYQEVSRSSTGSGGSSSSSAPVSQPQAQNVSVGLGQRIPGTDRYVGGKIGGLTSEQAAGYVSSGRGSVITPSSQTQATQPSSSGAQDRVTGFTTSPGLALRGETLRPTPYTATSPGFQAKLEQAYREGDTVLEQARAADAKKGAKLYSDFFEQASRQSRGESFIKTTATVIPGLYYQTEERAAVPNLFVQLSTRYSPRNSDLRSGVPGSSQAVQPLAFSFQGATQFYKEAAGRWVSGVKETGSAIKTFFLPPIKGVAQVLYAPNYPVVDPLTGERVYNKPVVNVPFLDKNLRVTGPLYKSPDVQAAGVVVGIGTAGIVLGPFAEVGLGIASIPFAYQAGKKAYEEPSALNFATLGLTAIPTIGLVRAPSALALAKQELLPRLFLKEEKNVFAPETRLMGGTQEFPVSRSLPGLLESFEKTRTARVFVRPSIRQTNTLVADLTVEDRPTFVTPDYAVKVIRVGEYSRGGNIQAIHSSPIALPEETRVTSAGQFDTRTSFFRETPGLFVAPLGKGSPVFTGVGYLGSVKLGIIPSLNAGVPSGQIFTNIQGIRLVPEYILKQAGYNPEAQFLATQAVPGFAYLGKRELFAYKPFPDPLISKGVVRGPTRETEAVLPEITKIKRVIPKTGVAKFLGYSTYAKVQGRVVPLYRYKITNAKTGVSITEDVAAREQISALQRSASSSSREMSSPDFKVYPSFGKGLPSYSSLVSSRSSVGSFASQRSAASGVSASAVDVLSTQPGRSSPSRSFRGSSRTLFNGSSYVTGGGSSTFGGGSTIPPGIPPNISLIPPRPPTRPPKLSLPEFNLDVGKRRPGGKTSFKTQYEPSVEAVLFNVRGKRPSARLVSTGLVLRPMVR